MSAHNLAASATSFLANIPSPPQGVWQIGPVPLRAYALCIIAGIVVAILWGDRRWQARGGRKGLVTDIAVFAVPFGLVGGRLYHVATDWYKYFGPGRDPLDALKVWEGGLGIWGAVALGAVGAWIGCRRRGVPLAAFADAIAPALVTAQAMGRLGNWFNQELYGSPTTVPWGLEIYRRIDPETGMADQIYGHAIDQAAPLAVVHPTFLYELLWNLLVAVLIVWADRKFRMGRGRVFALYVAGYTAGRVWIEMMRTDEATHLLGIRINVFTSLIVFALAVIYLLVVRGKREDPASLRGKPLPGDDDYGVEPPADGESGGTASATEDDRPSGSGASKAEADPDPPEREDSAADERPKQASATAVTDKKPDETEDK
ncbi:prolipoprotein diacylglyceryl transferase [Saccharopolyspora gloriosae]|uniref:Phosphatidylglycerol--prolipoprotein diacylglyceryl transferase n=1 Tax=Saccharopolyspora gloriosae TaxID=455344 RepID=A0A840NGV5_9PSEU|nr:prolipoprotein diacylglyceryl transferase [Saccharopolyspora gloriosae]